jgi:hypothetical protein
MWLLDGAAPSSLVEAVDRDRVGRGEVGEEIVICITLD